MQFFLQKFFLSSLKTVKLWPFSKGFLIRKCLMLKGYY